MKCQDLGQNGGIWSGIQPRALTRLRIRSSASVPAPVSLVLGIFNVNYYSKIIFLLFFFFFNQAKEREQIPGNWLKHDTKGPGKIQFGTHQFQLRVHLKQRHLGLRISLVFNNNNFLI